ncbi:iron complex outermembrane receptor protein [Oxalobacteraceae bacterium GrIS 2.11]
MKFQRNRIAMAVALALNAGMIHAQQAASNPATETTQNAAAPAAQSSPDASTPTQIVVTGIRASREHSLKMKRDADSVMDVVTAEDIGKLPDKNVADAVERVPGVNISSGSGGQGGFSENDRVSIRGTSSSLTQTTINGHSVSTGDWYIGDQQSSVGRSVSFTLLPSEIVGSVEVQKSSQADFIEGGTSGNVNIVTRLPLDFKKQLTVEATGQALYADLPKKTAPQFNGLINWKNDDNTVGVLVQGFYEKRYERRDGQELFLLGSGSISPVANPGGPSYNDVIAAHPDLNGVAFPTQIGSAAFSQTSERSGGLFDVQMKPMAGLTLDVNGFYSRFHTDTFDTNFMASPLNELSAGISPSTYTVRNGTLVAASFPQTDYASTGAFPGVRDSIFRPGAGSSAGYLDFDAKYRVSDTLTVSAKIGFTKGVGQTPHDYGYEAYLINSPMSYVLNGNRGPAMVSFSNLDTTNFNSPNVINGGSWAQSATVVDQETYAQSDALWTLYQGYIESIKFGVRFADHKRSAYDVGYSCASGYQPDCSNNWATFAPKPNWSGTQSPSNFGSGIGFGPGFIQHFWVLNVNDLSAWQQQYNNVNTGPAYQNNFNIEEKDSAAYAMSNLVGEGWRGNVGLRLVNTKQTGLAYGVEANVDPAIAPTIVPLNSSHNYLDVLPSANLKFDLSKDLVARLAASRTMSRPDYSAISPAVVLNNLDLTGSGGNANLKAIKSNNADATLEWYFAPQSILSAGVFYMDMPSYVGAGVTTANYLNTSTNTVANFTINLPVNTSAKNEGLELAWQQSFGAGFGALANLTLANGHDSNGMALVGASKDTGNLEFYYENDRLSTRLAYTYRSEFLVGMANVTEQYQAGFGQLAASINYKINDNLSITFDGLNLNNPTLRYYSNADQPQAFYTNGRQYYLGLRMSL